MQLTFNNCSKQLNKIIGSYNFYSISDKQKKKKASMTTITIVIKLTTTTN